MQLAIDFGTTYAKAGVFTDHTCVKAGPLDAIIAEYPLAEFAHIVVGVVGSNGRNWVKAHEPDSRLIEVNTAMDLPIRLDYRTPQTLGVDRLAAAVEASARFPGSDVLVIDSGTCITYDIVDRKGVYRGGLISPGWNMRLQAMHRFTASLPDVEVAVPVDRIGKSTSESMRSGAYYGLIAEINGHMNSFRRHYPELKIVLSGGNVKFFESMLKEPIFALSNLVISGLNRILLYHVG